MNAPPPANDSQELPAQEELLVMVYDQLRRLAAKQMVGQQGGSQTLQPTALVHEAWLRLSSENGSFCNDSQHFFRAAAVAMRHILVDRARGKSSLKRGGARVDLSFANEVAHEQNPGAHILVMDECLKIMEQHHPECTKVVQLKFFAGLSNQETATLLGSSLRSVERQWAFARAKLFQMIRDREQAGEHGS